MAHAIGIQTAIDHGVETGPCVSPGPVFIENRASDPRPHPSPRTARNGLHKWAIHKGKAGTKAGIGSRDEETGRMRFTPEVECTLRFKEGTVMLPISMG
jgi:hypothetical protein